MTNVKSNGSKWSGEEPDSIETLLEVLSVEPLDRSFENYGNFAIPHEGEPGEVNFFGNFFKLSHVFNIDSSDPVIISKLTAAIRANQKRKDYLSQHKPKPK